MSEEIAAHSGFAFVHVPKTAGTSFLHALDTAVGSVYLDYHNPLFMPPEVLSAEEVMQHGGYKGISGHVPATKYLGTAKRNSWALVTFVRHPVDRAFSHFASKVGFCWMGVMRSEKNLKFCEDRPSFIDWLKSPESDSNSFIRGLNASASAFDFIGQAERFDDSIAAFNATFGASLAVLKINVSMFKFIPTEAERAEAFDIMESEIRVYETFKTASDAMLDAALGGIKSGPANAAA
jgi:hypothetical protein